MKFSLHLQAHEGIERFKNGVLSANKIDKLLSEARRWRQLGDTKTMIQFKWKIVRNADLVVVAQSKNYLR